MTNESKESVQTDEENEEIEIIDAEDQVVEDSEENDTEANDETQSELEKITEEKDELYDRYLRLQAEYANFTNRTQREKVADRKYKSQDLATELLPVLDNFERALQVDENDDTKSVLKGITMVYNQLKSALESADIQAIEAEGQQFDPELHHAVMQEPNPDVESNIILEELQKGYILHDRVIRPAMVKVSE